DGEYKAVADALNQQGVLYSDSVDSLVGKELEALNEVKGRLPFFIGGLNSAQANFEALESFKKDPKRFLTTINNKALEELRASYRDTFQEDHWRKSPSKEPKKVLESLPVSAPAH